MRGGTTRLTGLWRHADFLKLWAGQTVSVFGDQIGLLALPPPAVLTLQANAGPGLAGGLVQLVTAPLAILVDAVSFVVSVASLLLIRAPEPAPAARAERGSIRDEIGEGLRVVLGNPLLRAIAGCTGTSNLF